MLKIAICDDNKSICAEVENMILDYSKFYNYKMDIEVFNSGENLLKYIQNEHNFDLIFLDIELGRITGVGVGEVIRNEMKDHLSKIVFISGEDGYEMDLFNIQPLNFLRKPVDKNKIFKCIDLCLKLIGIENKSFEYKKGHDTVKVKIKDILYFEKTERKIKIVTTDEEDIFNESISCIKTRLPQNFIETHESFLVNFNKIIKFKKDYIIMENSEELPVSRRNIQSIRTMIINMEREK